VHGRGESAFIPGVGGQDTVFFDYQIPQVFVYLSGHGQGLLIGIRADGHDDEFLDLQVVGRELSTVEKIHQWHRQHVTIRIQIAVQGQFTDRRSGTGNRKGSPKNRIGPQPALVGCSIQDLQGRIDPALLGDIHADQGPFNFTVDMLDGL